MTSLPMKEAQPPGKRERTKQANRAAILEAARDVFAEIGYGAASIRDIVRRTDLATGTFYNYFPDKESVLAAVLDETAGEARELVRAAFAHRRKALARSVEHVRPGSIVAVRAALEELGLPADARAEALAPDDFAALSAKLRGSD